MREAYGPYRNIEGYIYGYKIAQYKERFYESTELYFASQVLFGSKYFSGQVARQPLITASDCSFEAVPVRFVETYRKEDKRKKWERGRWVSVSKTVIPTHSPGLWFYCLVCPANLAVFSA